MIENLQAVNVFSPPIAEIILNLLVSLTCSFIISLIYRFTYNGAGYSESFVKSIVFLSVITSLVIMVIGNNLARAFGLVGALSIIRFRTAIKDTMDIVYIFLSLAIGMAAGVGYHRLAVTGTIMVGLIFLLFSNGKMSFLLSNQYMLQFVLADVNDKNSDYKKVLSNYCISYETINIRSCEDSNSLEYSFYIRVKKYKDSDELVRKLNGIEGISKLNIFFDRQNS